ncbi:MAG: RDD family protein [Acidobacteriota bacterium]
MASFEPELTLHGNDRRQEGPADFDLPPIVRHSDKLSGAALDLDRLFGDPDQPKPAATTPPPPAVMIAAELIERAPIETSEPAALSMSTPMDSVVSDEGALPFEDAPIVPPPAARPPLAVRRSTPEVPRNRPRTTRPIKADSLNLESASPKSSIAAQAAAETVALLAEMPSLGVRVGAGLIDVVLLVGIDAAVLYLTLRVTGLQNSIQDLRVLPPVPFVGFLAILAFGYVAAFTVAGGQTIGKMLLSLRVIGDDGRPVDASGGMLRALGCMLVPLTLGLSYVPVLFTSDHRAVHDRLAGTRVVQE